MTVYVLFPQYFFWKKELIKSFHQHLSTVETQETYRRKIVTDEDEHRLLLTTLGTLKRFEFCSTDIHGKPFYGTQTIKTHALLFVWVFKENVFVRRSTVSFCEIVEKGNIVSDREGCPSLLKI